MRQAQAAQVGPHLGSGGPSSTGWVTTCRGQRAPGGALTLPSWPANTAAAWGGERGFPNGRPQGPVGRRGGQNLSQPGFPPGPQGGLRFPTTAGDKAGASQAEWPRATSPRQQGPARPGGPSPCPSTARGAEVCTGAAGNDGHLPELDVQALTQDNKPRP